MTGERTNAQRGAIQCPGTSKIGFYTRVSYQALWVFVTPRGCFDMALVGTRISILEGSTPFKVGNENTVHEYRIHNISHGRG